MEIPGRYLHFGGSKVTNYLEKPFKHRVKVAPTTGATLTRFLKGFLNNSECHQWQNVDLGLELPFSAPFFYMV